MSGIVIQVKRGTSQQLAELNPRLKSGEPCKETDTDRFKIGDGTRRWRDLPYFSADGEVSEGPLGAHIEDATPHPAYDDLPSLTLTFENGLI